MTTRARWAYFARCVIEGTDVVLRTENRTKWLVLFSSDAVSAIVTVMLKGARGGVYMAANHATFATIREIADGRIGVRYDNRTPPQSTRPISMYTNCVR